MCITESMDDTEAHTSYRLGSPLASIAGIAQSILERTDLDEDLTMRLRAIRDLALDALRVDRADDDRGAPPRK